MQNKANQTKEPTQDRNQTTQPIHLTHPNNPTTNQPELLYHMHGCI